MQSATMKVKGPASSVKKLLSGGVGGGFDTTHSGLATKETKNKVQQAQRFNKRQQPSPSGLPPASYGPKVRLAQQPQSGE